MWTTMRMILYLPNSRIRVWCTFSLSLLRSSSFLFSQISPGLQLFWSDNGVWQPSTNAVSCLRAVLIFPSGDRMLCFVLAVSPYPMFRVRGWFNLDIHNYSESFWNFMFLPIRSIHKSHLVDQILLVWAPQTRRHVQHTLTSLLRRPCSTLI